jgi:uncharacterized membrane protein YhaH (DUF805 family)
MDYLAFIWFEFSGRIGRAAWLGFAVLISVLEFATEIMLRRAFHWPFPDRGSDVLFLTAYLGDEISLLATLIFLWPSLAIDVKRWHDLGLSGWFVLIVHLPSAVLFGFALKGAGGTMAHPNPQLSVALYLFGLTALIYFIWLAARKGEPDKNRYGPAPD